MDTTTTRLDPVQSNHRLNGHLFTPGHAAPPPASIKPSPEQSELSDVESAVLDAAHKAGCIVSSKKLAALAGYAYAPHFRTAVASLTRAGLLVRLPEGLRVAQADTAAIPVQTNGYVPPRLQEAPPPPLPVLHCPSHWLRDARTAFEAAYGPADKLTVIIKDQRGNKLALLPMKDEEPPNEAECRILKAAQKCTRPVSSKTLVRLAGYRLNSYSLGVITALTRAGLLLRTPDGLRAR